MEQLRSADGDGGVDYGHTVRPVDDGGRPAKVVGGSDAGAARYRDVVVHGVSYRFTLPKAYHLLRVVRQAQARGEGDGAADLAAFDLLLDTVLGCLDAGQADAFRGRLDAADDPLDVGDVIEVFQYLQAEATGRPTGGQSA